MILIVVYISGVATQEVEICIRSNVAYRTHDIIGIKTILLGTKHINGLRNGCPTTIHIGGNTGCHTLATLGVDKDYTIGGTGTVNGRTVLHYLYILDILYIY